MKKYVVLLLFIGFSQLSFSQQNFPQEKLPTQSAYLELGGAGLIYSFNYDFRFDSQRRDGWGMRVGAGGYGTSNDSFFSLPVMVNKLYGRGPHFFEMGMGFTFFTFDEGSFSNYSYCVSGSFDSNGNYICNQFSDDAPYQMILPVDGNPSLMGTLSLGYRRVPVNGGFMWKASLTPVFNNNGFWPLFVGVGLGYAF
jgi:hypothetical protein